MAGAIAGALTGVVALSFLEVALSSKDGTKELGTVASLTQSAVNRLVNPSIPLIGSAKATTAAQTPATSPIKTSPVLLT